MRDFEERVGMLIEDDLERLEALGFGEDMVEDNGMFETWWLGELQAFCKAHPEYHIVTAADGDDGNLLYLNTVAYVNRIGYYLADGDKDETLFTTAH
jgi:hypothetical protein